MLIVRNSQFSWIFVWNWTECGMMTTSGEMEGDENEKTGILPAVQ